MPRAAATAALVAFFLAVAPAAAAERASLDEAKAMAEKAATFLKAEGKAKAIAAAMLVQLRADEMGERPVEVEARPTAMTAAATALHILRDHNDVYDNDDDCGDGHYCGDDHGYGDGNNTTQTMHAAATTPTTTTATNATHYELRATIAQVRATSYNY